MQTKTAQLLVCMVVSADALYEIEMERIKNNSIAAKLLKPNELYILNRTIIFSRILISGWKTQNCDLNFIRFFFPFPLLLRMKSIVAVSVSQTVLRPDPRPKVEIIFLNLAHYRKQIEAWINHTSPTTWGTATRSLHKLSELTCWRVRVKWAQLLESITTGRKNK